MYTTHAKVYADNAHIWRYAATELQNLFLKPTSLTQMPEIAQHSSKPWFKVAREKEACKCQWRIKQLRQLHDSPPRPSASKIHVHASTRQPTQA